MSAKRAQLSVERIEPTHATETVCDYDELDEIVRDELGELSETADTTVTIDSFAAALVDACGCDVVKYTEYYRISRV
ncbi:MAG: hypothetical protein ABEI77_06025 [Halorientalis sp.]